MVNRLDPVDEGTYMYDVSFRGCHRDTLDSSVTVRVRSASCQHAVGDARAQLNLSEDRWYLVQTYVAGLMRYGESPR